VASGAQAMYYTEGDFTARLGTGLDRMARDMTFADEIESGFKCIAEPLREKLNSAPIHNRFDGYIE
jgi:hypothetical protein